MWDRDKEYTNYSQRHNSQRHIIDNCAEAEMSCKVSKISPWWTGVLPVFLYRCKCWTVSNGWWNCGESWSQWCGFLWRMKQSWRETEINTGTGNCGLFWMANQNQGENMSGIYEIKQDLECPCGDKGTSLEFTTTIEAQGFLCTSLFSLLNLWPCSASFATEAPHTCCWPHNSRTQSVLKKKKKSNGNILHIQMSSKSNNGYATSFMDKQTKNLYLMGNVINIMPATLSSQDLSCYPV